MFPQHDWYVEVFGGSATFLFKKERSKVEVYNDINDDMYTFFKVLRDKSDELEKRVNFLPPSRSVFDEYVQKMKDKSWSDDVDRAIAVMYLSRFAFGGKWQSTSPYFTNNKEVHTRREFAWSSVRENIQFFARRFDLVTVEHLDFRELIPKYDVDGVFFYLDPPYYDINSSYYKNDFVLKDHEDLAKILRTVKGKFMLSYTSNDDIKALYEGFNIQEKDFVNFITGKDFGEDRVNRKEMIITNYDTEKDRWDSLKSKQTKVI
jgi:DNA adenine methylase